MQASPIANTDALGDFRSLYRHHYGFVWHALHRFGVPAALVDDALQDTFVVAYRRRLDFTGGSRKAWLYGIARRVASNYRRGAQRVRRRGQAVADTATGPHQTLPQAHEALHELERFMEDLRPSDRELFVLSELEGMTGPEISDALGQNLHTTYSRIRRLRRGFAARIADEGVIARTRKARPRATARSWAMLMPALNLSERSSHFIPWLTSLKWSMVGAGAGGAVVLSAVVMAHGPRAPEPEAKTTPSGPPLRSTTARNVGPGGDEHQASASDPHHPLAVARPAASAGSPAQPAASVGSPARISRGSVLPSPSSDEGRATASPREAHHPATEAPRAEPPRAEPPHAEPRATAPTPTTAPTPAPLAKQTRLLRRASQSLQQGDPARALAIAEQHAREFPRSPLTDLRTALRIESLCALGQHARAQGEARAFLHRPGGSPVTERIRRACPAQNPAPVDKPGA